MPISQGAAGGITGMQLKAWLLAKQPGSVQQPMVIIKSQNIATAVWQASGGQMDVTFSAAMAGTNYICRRAIGSPAAAVSLTNVTTAGCRVASPDEYSLWEFWE